MGGSVRGRPCRVLLSYSSPLFFVTPQSWREQMRNKKENKILDREVNPKLCRGTQSWGTQFQIQCLLLISHRWTFSQEISSIHRLQRVYIKNWCNFLIKYFLNSWKIITIITTERFPFNLLMLLQSTNVYTVVNCTILVFLAKACFTSMFALLIHNWPSCTLYLRFL